MCLTLLVVGQIERVTAPYKYPNALKGKSTACGARNRRLQQSSRVLATLIWMRESDPAFLLMWMATATAGG
jgi:hypothetical protein